MSRSEPEMTPEQAQQVLAVTLKMAEIMQEAARQTVAAITDAAGLFVDVARAAAQREGVADAPTCFYCKAPMELAAVPVWPTDEVGADGHPEDQLVMARAWVCLKCGAKWGEDG